MYKMWDLIRRYIPLIKCMKLESRKVLTIAILSHFLLVPALYFTAKYGDQGWMIILASFLGLTNGYLTICALTSVPNLHALFGGRRSVETPSPSGREKRTIPTDKQAEAMAGIMRRFCGTAG
ncbi:equilibrative nucleotide transporter 3-like [Rhododendron vialii]|uniref:equilibrative nucleotide transporter 3-like n=1 Tax=Rhododendron vialii TaxID=182163 RepID=UPI00265EDF60|nr:equilibrative nucleotide transporter 3-like [Rhododendron vialii]